MALFRADHGWGGGERQKTPSSLIKAVIHILQWWHLEELYFTWRRSKQYINHVIQTLSSADIRIRIFSSKISNFCYIKKYKYGLHFNTEFLILLTFLGLLKIKVFLNKGYSVIISAQNFSNTILSRDSNYTVDMVLWPMFGNSRISTRENVISIKPK